MSIRRAAAIGALTAFALAQLPFASSAADRHERLLEVEGHTREYLMSVPHKQGPLPTIIALHGTLLNAQRTMNSMGLQPLVDREGLALVYPNAVAAQWKDGRSVATALTTDIDDVWFMRRLIEELVNTGISDPRRVYVTGFSNGGMMALRLICEAPELIAAAAPIAANLPAELIDHCRPIRATPLLLMNGTADPIVPYDGGALAFGGGQVLSTDRDDQFLAQRQPLFRSGAGAGAPRRGRR